MATSKMIRTPRLRMFAGPNGSGKSTLKNMIQPELLGVYINSDDIEQAILQQGFLDLQGGHDVPKGKIISRYTRSLSKLHTAIRYSDRAYIFDNSGHSHVWLAEITAAKEITIKQDYIPQWFQDYVLDALSQGEV